MSLRQSIISAVTITLLMLPVFPARSVDEAMLSEFTVLMDSLIVHVEQIESGYNPSLIGNIARTRRLEVYNANIAELEGFVTEASGRTDSNSTRLVSLLSTIESTDPTTEAMKPLLLECRVRSVLLECTVRGIGADVVAEYVKRGSASFVADRGNFFHPEFDQSNLGSQDFVRIFFTGFGLVILVQMDGGIEMGIELYNGSTELKPYFAQQLVFRGADLDMVGIPLIQAVLTDPAITPPAREVFYGVLAGKLIGPAGQYAEALQLSDEWKTTVSGWVMQHIVTPERLEARQDLPFYGVEFSEGELGPESLLGLIGPASEANIATLLASSSPMEQVCGLEALRWFNLDIYPDEAARLFAMAEPIMGNEDFILAVLALNTYETDAIYTGEPYDEPRRERLQTNLPVLIELMNRALANENIEYMSTSAWWDLYQEGSLTSELAGLMPMVAQVIVSDWNHKQAGEIVYLPETEITLLTHFMPENIGLFDQTSPSLLGFLVNELDTGTVNPFTIWVYLDYLKAAKSIGIVPGEDWINAVARVREWANNAPALYDRDQLLSLIDEILIQ